MVDNCIGGMWGTCNLMKEWPGGNWGEHQNARRRTSVMMVTSPWRLPNTTGLLSRVGGTVPGDPKRARWQQRASVDTWDTAPGLIVPLVPWLPTAGGLRSMPAQRVLSELSCNQIPCDNRYLVSGKQCKQQDLQGQTLKSAHATGSPSPKQVSHTCCVSLTPFKCRGRCKGMAGTQGWGSRI